MPRSRKQTEIFLPKKMQDAICEFADAKKCSYLEAEKEFLICFRYMEKRFKKPAQFFVDKINLLPPDQLMKFFDEVREV